MPRMYEHDESYDNSDSDDQQSFPALDERRVSFNDRNNSYYSRTAAFYGNLLSASQREEWQLVSPMTHHIFPSDRSEEMARLPRRRSRSFNDYIETRENQDEDGHNYTFNSSPLPAWPIDSNQRTSSFLSSSRRSRSDGSLGSFSGNLSIDELPTKDMESEATSKPLPTVVEESMPVSLSVLYGAINCTIVLPVIMSFGNIIYRDDAFLDYMPFLIKLTLVSGLVHQLCFSIFSSLPFAVGSVQDAGLIFLSKMAHDMVQYCRVHEYDDETMLATVTVGLGCAAAALGVGLIIIGKLGLASYVQMLPTCVVAGYLAYIGWFVGYSGLGIMAGASALTPELLVEKAWFIWPGVLGGTFIYVSVRKFRHVAVLPTCITLLLVVFYLMLMATGTTVEEATAGGWIRPTEEDPEWYHTWDYLKIDKVVWRAYPQLWLTWSGMLFVVALSSSLDVAAIELEMATPLDYNKELGMVGISNLVSGLTGGYTGSYIFSQTIFSLRIGVKSRISGFAIAFFTLVIIVMPFPILSYVPNFFYGSLLSMICIDLVYEWLWEFRHKVTLAEYIIGLSTFGLIQVLGVEYGILAGVAVYAFCRQMKIDVGELKQVYSSEEDIQASLSDIPEEATDETSKLMANGNGSTYNGH